MPWALAVRAFSANRTGQNFSAILGMHPIALAYDKFAIYRCRKGQFAKLSYKKDISV